MLFVFKNYYWSFMCKKKFLFIYTFLLYGYLDYFVLVT